MKFIQKNWLVIVLGLAIVVSIILNSSVLRKNNTDVKIENEISALTKGINPQCFLYEEAVNSEAKNESQELGFNREFVEIVVTDNGLVTGQHLILPFEKDSNIADFVGIKQEGVVNVAATARAEREIWQEQRVYLISQDKLFIGYQEVFVPKYKNDAGIYMFEDINKLTFETDTFFLSRVNCASVERSTF
jgi:hypothetical protein